MGPNYLVPYFVSKANELGGLNGNPDNPGGDQYDAFRHAYASALLASYSGNNTSKAIMDAYENKDPAPNWWDPKFSNYEKNRNMDLWNNDVGREEYYNWKKSFENGNTSDTLDVWIYNKVKEGATINDFNEQGRTYIEPPLDSNDYSGENSSFSEILNGANRDFNVWLIAQGIDVNHFLTFLQNNIFTPTYNKLDEILSYVRNLLNLASTIPSPIVLDLNGDGVTTTALTSGTYFDHAGDGFAEQTAWVSPEDGLLVRDLNHNGTIDTGAELFGNNTKLANGQKAVNGFLALADLDTNKDGKIDASDTAFSELQVWKDVNGDGITSAGELHSLAELGIVSISTAYTASSTVDANGNSHSQTGTYTTTDGQTRAATDVWFKTDSLYSFATEILEVPEDILNLPEISGYGHVRSLQQAMA